MTCFYDVQRSTSPDDPASGARKRLLEVDAQTPTDPPAHAQRQADFSTTHPFTTSLRRTLKLRRRWNTTLPYKDTTLAPKETAYPEADYTLEV